MTRHILITSLFLGTLACSNSAVDSKNNTDSSSNASSNGSEETNSGGQDSSASTEAGSSADETANSESGSGQDETSADTSTPDNSSQDQTGDSSSAGNDSSTGEETTSQTDTTSTEEEPLFSFFVTSIETMRLLSGSEDGFGGDLGGLEGADSICQRTAENEGFKTKTWRAFLSVTKGPDGNPIHAIDRVGEGPWYDRNGRLIAMDKAGLLSDRPDGDAQSIADLPNERGESQEQFGDNHDTVTGSNKMGMLYDPDPETTCQDWTSIENPKSGMVMGGHSWPAKSGTNWMQAHSLHSCVPGVNLIQDGPGSGECIGCGGGYGGIYCFALTP